MSDTAKRQPPKTELIVISLHPPKLFDVILRLLKAMEREFPGARWLPGNEDGNLVIEVDTNWLDEDTE